jgi:PKHD-type hydroxylase
MFREVNAYYDFELMGFIDAPQYTSYGPGQRYDWHLDLGASSTPSVRKLSLTVQLTEESEYAGGDLEFLSGRVGPRPKAIGTATFFPAFLPHRVSPVTSGLRRSLVAWACGPSFR